MLPIFFQFLAPTAESRLRSMPARGCVDCGKNYVSIKSCVYIKLIVLDRIKDRINKLLKEKLN